MRAAAEAESCRSMARMMCWWSSTTRWKRSIAEAMSISSGAQSQAAQAAYDVLARAIETGFGGDDGIGSMLRVVEAEGGVTLELAAPAVASGGG